MKKLNKYKKRKAPLTLNTIDLLTIILNTKKSTTIITTNQKSLTPIRTATSF